MQGETPMLPHVRFHQIVGAMSKTGIERNKTYLAFRDFILAKTQGDKAVLVTHKEFRVSLSEYSETVDRAFQQHFWCG